MEIMKRPSTLSIKMTTKKRQTVRRVEEKISDTIAPVTDNVRICAHDLFTFFTAGVIKEDVTFTR
jgi:hypothetical protein